MKNNLTITKMKNVNEEPPSIHKQTVSTFFYQYLVFSKSVLLPIPTIINEIYERNVHI